MDYGMENYLVNDNGENVDGQQQHDDVTFQDCHQDIITHIALDATGRRMATCSADKRLAVWDRDDKGKWTRSACWKVHGGLVYKAVWGHPEFGQILATCSCDRTVHIWEQIRSNGDRKWIRRAYLTDSGVGMSDIAFAPRHHGLQLATVCTAGIVRIYEAVDVMDLTKWSIILELKAFHTRCSAVAWSPSPIHLPLIVVGSDDVNANRNQRVVVYELSDGLRKWQRCGSLQMDLAAPVTDIQFSPILNGSFHQVAVAAGDVYIYNMKVPSSAFVDEDGLRLPATTDSGYSLVKTAQLGLGDIKKAWRIRFNLLGNVLCASSGDGTVRMFKSMFVNQWVLLTEMKPENYVDDDEENVAVSGYLTERGRGMVKESTAYY